MCEETKCGTYNLSSSIRSSAPEETLAKAKLLADQLGISRVTDITRLDLIGLPVYASIRPTAKEGSLCVNAGKGLKNIEAKVGAFMEAIEFALAEVGASEVDYCMKTARDILDGKSRPDAILDFCPALGSSIDIEDPIGCVQATNIHSGECSYVPAELVFLPCPREVSGPSYFGSNSNGLASGNTVDEATLHGLLEIIERDIRSFQSVKDTSALVRTNTLPQALQPTIQQLIERELTLNVRYMENIFGLPYFMAIISENNNPNPIYISGGYGCHLSKDIAVIRAVCEAAQSRLSFIHGGRDDLTERYSRFESDTYEAKKSYWSRLIGLVSANEEEISFNEIHDKASSAHNVESALEVVLKILSDAGDFTAYRVIYTSLHSPLHVVRTLVPKLEFFNESTARVGKRLRDHVKQL